MKSPWNIENTYFDITPQLIVRISKIRIGHYEVTLIYSAYVKLEENIKASLVAYILFTRQAFMLSPI